MYTNTDTIKQIMTAFKARVLATTVTPPPSGIIPNPVVPLFGPANLPADNVQRSFDNGSQVLTINFSREVNANNQNKDIDWHYENPVSGANYNTLFMVENGFYVQAARNGSIIAGTSIMHFTPPVGRTEPHLATDRFRIEVNGGYWSLYQEGTLLGSGNYGGLTGTNVRIKPSIAYTNVTFGSDVTPLVVTKSEINGDRSLTIYIRYVGSPTGWETSNQTGGGAVLSAFEDVDIVSNTKGVMVLKTRTPFPASQLGNSVRCVIRQKNNTSINTVAFATVLGGAKRLAIGQNISNIMYTDKAGYWQDKRHYNDGKGGTLGVGEAPRNLDGSITADAVGTPLNMRCGRPDLRGAEQIATWKEGQTTGVSDWNYYGASEKDGTRQTWTNVTKGFNSATGEYFIRGIPQLDYDRAGDMPWVVFDSKKVGARIIDFKMGNIGADYTQRFTDEFMTHLIGKFGGPAPYPKGPIRTMETMVINHHAQNYSWANRPTPSNKGIPAGGGESIEGHIEWQRSSHRPLMLLIGYRWTEDFVKKMIRAFFTGEGLENGGLGVTSDCYIHLTLVGNEPWNFGLTGLYQALKADGYAKGYTDAQYGSENEVRMKMQVDRHNEVLEWVKQAIPEFMDRVIITWAGAPGQHWSEFQFALSQGLKGVQAVESSIYFGISAKARNYGNNTPAELLQPWLDDVDEQIGLALNNFNQYKALGIRRTIYEVGMDNFPGAGRVMTYEQAVAWAKSPEYIQVYRKGLNRLANEFGDDVALYFDIDTDETYWGHYAPNVSRRKWDLALEIQAQVNSGS